MNEALLCAAIFEQAITDYEKAKRRISAGFRRFSHPSDEKITASQIISDVRSFATGQDAIKYAGGSEKVIRAFIARLDDIDREYSVLRG